MHAQRHRERNLQAAAFALPPATTLPLREYSRRYAAVVAQGTRRTPMRVERRPILPADIVRVVRAERVYLRGYERLYRDYPPELWN